MIYIKYLKSLLFHKWYVLRAGLFLGVPLWRLIIHDWTKFLPVEFFRYARNFFGDYTQSPNDREVVSEDFILAWLHHENSNKHHHGYWIPRTGKSAGDPLPMPEIYIREMVADFMGASRAYTGKWDITKWLNDNGPNMILHRETERLLACILIDDMGFFNTDNCMWSLVNFEGSKLRLWSGEKFYSH